MIARRELTSLLKREAFPAYSLFSLSRALLKDAVAVAPHVRQGDLRWAHADEISACRRSDVLFVMGSGASVNRYSADVWDRIGREDSIGFNFWVVHDFIPRFYAMELTVEPGSAHSAVSNEDEKLYAWLRARAPGYADVPLLLKGSRTLGLVQLDKLGPLRSQARGMLMPKLAGETEAEVQRAARWWMNAAPLLQRLPVLMVPHRRASIVFNVLLAALAGYREIVLCGVDLNNILYFWEEDLEHYRKVGPPIPETLQSGAVHKTFDKSHRELTVDRILDAIDVAVLAPRGIRLWVGARSSALHPRFPCFF